MNIKNFDKQNVNILREEINENLKAIGEKYGLELHLGNIRYSEEDFSGKLEVKVAKTEEEKEEKARKEWVTYAHYFDMDAEAFGKTFTCKGKEYKIIGILPNRRKYPVLAVCLQDGKQLLFTSEVAKIN